MVKNSAILSYEFNHKSQKHVFYVSFSYYDITFCPVVCTLVVFCHCCTSINSLSFGTIKVCIYKLSLNVKRFTKTFTLKILINRWKKRYIGEHVGNFVFSLFFMFLTNTYITITYNQTTYKYQSNCKYTKFIHIIFRINRYQAFCYLCSLLFQWSYYYDNLIGLYLVCLRLSQLPAIHT